MRVIEHNLICRQPPENTLRTTFEPPLCHLPPFQCSFPSVLSVFQPWLPHHFNTPFPIQVPISAWPSPPLNISGNNRKQPEITGNTGFFGTPASGPASPTPSAFYRGFIPVSRHHSTTPLLQHSIPQIFKEQHRLPQSGSDQIVWDALLVPIINTRILSHPQKK